MISKAEYYLTLVIVIIILVLFLAILKSNTVSIEDIKHRIDVIESNK